MFSQVLFVSVMITVSIDLDTIRELAFQHFYPGQSYRNLPYKFSRGAHARLLSRRRQLLLLSLCENFHPCSAEAQLVLKIALLALSALGITFELEEGGKCSIFK